MVPIQITQPTELLEAALLTSRTLITSPVIAAVFGERQQRMDAAVKLAFERLSCRIYAAKDDGRIVAAMRVTESPTCFPASMERLRLLPSLLALDGSLRNFVKWQKAWEQHDPKEPHLHISSLAVLPEKQKQGVGRQLVDHFCNLADSKSLAGYLETDRKENVSYYERFGFELVGEGAILNQQNWFMLRPRR